MFKFQLWAAAIVGAVALSATLAAQEPSRLGPSCGGTGMRCGVADRSTGVMVVPRAFERMSAFSEGLAAVRLNGRWSFIDGTGRMITEPRFELAGSFAFGHAEIILDRKSGVIDRTGKIVVEPRFARAVPLTSEVLLVRDGEWPAEIALESSPPDGLSGPFLMSERDWRLFHIRNGYVPVPQGAVLKKFDGSGRGFIWADVGARNRPLFGLLRADGAWQIEPQFNSVQERLLHSSADAVAVVTGSDVSGFVNGEGKLAFPLIPYQITRWDGDFGLVQHVKRHPELPPLRH